MTRQDFILFGINRISAEEIIGTGAGLADVNACLISNLNSFRQELSAAVILITDGLTTGKHKAPEHKSGNAVDFYIDKLAAGYVNIAHIVFLAVKHSFKGIGVYYNGKMYSFHFDLRKDFAAWTGIKKAGDKEWKYGSLLIDPKQLQKEYAACE